MYIILIMSVITFVAVILVIKRLCHKGTSSELKKVVIKRHIIYFVFFVLFLFHTNLHLLDKELKEYVSMDSYYLIAAVTNTVGIFMALIRLLEPYVL